MNETIKTILIAFIVVWAYNNYSKEGFSYRNTPAVLEGSNNMVLTDNNGNLSSIQFPSGMIMIWTKGLNNIPIGWALCDGTQGTPDLRGKFLLGVNTDPNTNAVFRTPGQSGGSTKISVGQLPAHTHMYRTIMYMGGADVGGGNTGPGGNWDNPKWNRNFYGGTEPRGDGEDYYPPFVTVAYIMKL